MARRPSEPYGKLQSFCSFRATGLVARLISRRWYHKQRTVRVVSWGGVIAGLWAGFGRRPRPIRRLRCVQEALARCCTPVRLARRGCCGVIGLRAGADVKHQPFASLRVAQRTWVVAFVPEDEIVPRVRSTDVWAGGVNALRLRAPCAQASRYLSHDQVLQAVVPEQGVSPPARNVRRVAVHATRLSSGPLGIDTNEATAVTV